MADSTGGRKADRAARQAANARSDGLSAGGAGAGPGGDEVLEEAQGLVEGQALAGAFGVLRCSVRNGWAAVTRVACRCQPVNERLSKRSSPRGVFSSR